MVRYYMVIMLGSAILGFLDDLLGVKRATFWVDGIHKTGWMLLGAFSAWWVQRETKES